MSLPEKPGFYSSSEAELRCTGWVSSKWAFNFIHLNLCFPTGQLNFIHSITHSYFYRFTFFPRANPNFIYHYNNYNHSFRESCAIQLVSLKSLSNIPKIFHGGYYHPFTQQFLISEFLVLSNRWVLEPICPKSLNFNTPCTLQRSKSPSKVNLTSIFIKSKSINWSFDIST